MRIIKLSILCFLIAVSGCDFSGNISARSGSLDDDYVAEPLSAAVKKYETALTTSNNIMHLFSQSKYRDVYRIYFSDRMKAQVTMKEFQTFMKQVVNNAGQLKAYKEMQWSFSSGTSEGLDLLYSVKVAEHENTMLNYLFIFERDKPYINLVGFSVKERQGVAAPGQF